MALTDYSAAPAAKRTLTVFLLLDTSGSMSGEKISAANQAIRETFPVLRNISESNADADINLAIMSFNNSCNWVTEGSVAASSLETWHDLTAGGGTSMGAAMLELDNKMSHKHGFLSSASGSFCPVAILVSDGQPTDNFAAGLKKLQENAWFAHATRIALAVGSDCDKKCLAEFSGTEEMVFECHNVNALQTCIKCMVITSSMVNTQHSSTAAPGEKAPTKAEQTCEALHQELDNVPGVSSVARAVDVSIDPSEFD